MNLDRKSGYAKGYAFIEFEKKQDADSAICELNGKVLLGRPTTVGWAFVSSETVMTDNTDKKSRMSD